MAGFVPFLNRNVISRDGVTLYSEVSCPVVIVAYQISEEIKQRTTKCHQNFRCLVNGGTCPVFTKIQVGLLIKESSCNQSCNYHFQIGNKSFYCQCPTRREMYERYGR